MRTDLGVEVWRGGVAPWECDQMGHMNVRFHLSRATEGLVGLAAALGMPQAMTAKSSATLRVDGHHVRFLKEARSAAALHMTGGLLEMGQSDALALLVMTHTHSGEPATTFRVRLSHVTPDGRVFPWSRAARERAAGLMITEPDYAAPRSLAAAPSAAVADRAEADRLGLETTAMGAIQLRECDALGRAQPETMIGRIAQGASHAHNRLYEALRHAPPPELTAPDALGGAVVEARLDYRRMPAAGEGLVIRGGLAALSASSRRNIYWLLDCAGEAVATAEMVTVSLDLNARRALRLPPEAVERAQAFVIPALAA